MIWDIVLFNLIEAHVELKHLRDKIVACMKPDASDERREFIEFAFMMRMEHAYHNVNTAWNCRHQDEQRAIRCSQEDFDAWEKFPLEFKDLWLPPSRCRGKAREPYNGRMFLSLPRINLDEAVFAIEGICCGIFRLLGKEIPEGFLREHRPESIMPMTEDEFRIQIRHLYICMNCAWNERKIDMAGDFTVSAAAVRRRCCFPRAFGGLWPSGTAHSR